MTLLYPPKPSYRRARWLYLPGTLLLTAVLIVSFFLWNPFWFFQRGTDGYLRLHGVRSHYTTVDGNRIHYIEALPPAGTPERPLLMVHGLGARAGDWSSLIPQLAAHGYHVYALDLLGYGDSAKPVDSDFGIRSEERVVLGFMQNMGLQQADVAGWSMGGWVAMKLALDHPERVRRLIVYDSAGLYFRVDFPLSLFSPRDKTSLEQLLARLEPNEANVKVPAVLAPGMLRKFKTNRWVLDRTLASMLAGPDILDFRLDGLKMPMLIVWGREDNLIPYSAAERLHELVPQSVLVGIPKCGHLVVAECPGQVIPPTLSFLDAEPAQSSSGTVLSAVTDRGKKRRQR